VYRSCSNIDAKIAYDSLNGKSVGIFNGEGNDDETSSESVGKILIFGEDNKVEKTIQMTRYTQVSNDYDDKLSSSKDDEKDIFGKKSDHHRMKDNLSILRFVKSNKCKGLEISSSGN